MALAGMEDLLMKSTEPLLPAAVLRKGAAPCLTLQFVIFQLPR